MAVRLIKKKEEERFRSLRRDDNDYSQHAVHDESNWLVSYADMMTLLCGFFILLFSMARLDAPRYEQARKALAEQFHGEYVAPPTQELARQVSEVAAQSGILKLTTIRSDATSVVVTFQSTLFFDSLSAEVKPEGRAILGRLIDGVIARQGKDHQAYKIVVEGHTDSQPIIGGNYLSNWELSGARASRVVRLFIDHGFPANQLVAVSYGDTRPAFPSRRADGSWDPDALARNRRVVLRIMEPAVTSIPMTEAGQSTLPPILPLRHGASTTH